MQCLGTTERWTQCKRITNHGFCSRHPHQHSVYVPPGPDWPKPEDIRPLVKRFTSEWLMIDWCHIVSVQYVNPEGPTSEYRRNLGRLVVVETIMRNIGLLVDTEKSSGLIKSIKQYLEHVPNNAEYLELFRRRCDTEYRDQCQQRYIRKILNQSNELDRDTVDLIVGRVA